MLPQHHAAAACRLPRPGGTALLLQQQQQQQQRHHCRSSRVPPAAAAAADAAAGTGLSPPQSLLAPRARRSTHAAPKLRSRSMPDSPLQGLWQAAAQGATWLELRGAAAVDKHAAAPFVVAALAGGMVGLGLDAPTLLAHGLPPYLADLLLHAFGAWDTTTWRLALTAAAVPLTAWALRAWWAGNLQLLAHGAGQLQQQLQQRWEQASPTTPSSSSEQQQAPGATAGASGSKWLAAAAAVFRGACLSALVGSLTSLLYASSSSIPSSLGGNSAWVTTAVRGLGAIAAALGAFGSLLLVRQPQQTASSKGSSSSTASLLGPLLALEAAWVASMAGLHPLVNAAAAAVVAGSLVLLQRTAVLPRLQQYMAAEGDDVAVHVSLSLAGTRPAFDSTAGDGSPLTLTAGPVPPEYAQLWEQASSGQLWDEAAAQEGGDAGASSSSGSSSGAPSVRQVQQELQAWLNDPQARWDSLRPFIAAAAQGLYLGETRSVALHNPPDIGYWHPAFSWWQPASDVVAKFGGEPPEAGDVFWFPVVDGAALPTRVKSIGQEFYELDANYGVTDTPLTLHVQLVELRK